MFQHIEQDRRFELEFEGFTSVVSYLLKDNQMYLTHSEVPSELRGKGIGKKLVLETFQYIEDHKIEAIAVCSYIKLVRDRSEYWSKKIG